LVIAMAPESPEDMQSPELQQSLAGLAAVLMGAAPLAMTLEEVAAFATSAIPGADGVGLTMLDSVRQDTMVASKDFVSAVDRVQYGLGEGPCITAVATRTTQVCGSLGGEPRWPKFGPQAGRLGVHSALSLPLIVADQVVGALNVYGRAHHAFSGEAVSIGERFSGPAAVTVANARALEQTRRLAEQLEQALVSRAVIDQAIGILMSRSGTNAEEAFASLRAMSQTDQIKLADVAETLVAQAVARARVRRPAL
jgi:GAF domain-containing protein